MSIVKESVSLRPESQAPTAAASGARAVTRGATALTPWPLVCKLCHTPAPAGPTAICEHCLGPLEPAPPADRALPNRETIASREPNLWRYREWLPFTSDAGIGDPFAAPLSPDTGFTPLVSAPRLADRLGVARCWVKNDAVSHPSLSFKDRVVAAAINAAHAFGLDTVGCASTGNLANAVAAHAARAGLPAWIFIPHDLELGKVVGTQVYNPNLVRIRGHYDDVNRLCAQVADAFGWGIVNVNLRAYYGEGSKTMAFEIAEQLGWRFPSAVVAPMAGGSLVTKLGKGFGEVAKAGLATGNRPRIYGTQAEGCAPIVNLVHSRDEQITPVVPNTIARSIAIGNPADGPFAKKAILGSGGTAVSVSDVDLVAGIRLLAESTGIFTETAGGVTVAGALALAAQGAFAPDDEVVLCITGNGLKTIEAITDPAYGPVPDAPIIDPKLREVRKLVEARS
jgi:threonine synthase